jgi:hypothetical protein
MDFFAAVAAWAKAQQRAAPRDYMTFSAFLRTLAGDLEPEPDYAAMEAAGDFDRSLVLHRIEAHAAKEDVWHATNP